MFAFCHKNDIRIVTDGGKKAIDKDILNRFNEQNITLFTINDIIDLDSYDNLRNILEIY